jgi:small subunit ribosomal protein S27Ae
MGGREGGKKEAAKKGKKQRAGKKHSSPKIYKFYETKGSEIHRNHKSCPRCGSGVFMAHHKNREYCGKCGYTVSQGKK